MEILPDTCMPLVWPSLSLLGTSSFGHTFRAVKILCMIPVLFTSFSSSAEPWGFWEEGHFFGNRKPSTLIRCIPVSYLLIRDLLQSHLHHKREARGQNYFHVPQGKAMVSLLSGSLLLLTFLPLVSLLIVLWFSVWIFCGKGVRKLGTKPWLRDFREATWLYRVSAVFSIKLE